MNQDVIELLIGLGVLGAILAILGGLIVWLGWDIFLIAAIVIALVIYFRRQILSMLQNAWLTYFPIVKSSPNTKYVIGAIIVAVIFAWIFSWYVLITVLLAGVVLTALIYFRSQIASLFAMLHLGGLMSIIKSVFEKVFSMSSGNFTCPYCIQAYKKNEILYVCPECKTTYRNKVSQKAMKCTKPGCGGYATIRRCPRCNHDLPQSVLETKNLPFSIIGVQSSGKSNYITVMLDELGRFTGLPVSLSTEDKETREHQKANANSIYVDHKPVPGTRSGDRMPQIWTIKNLSKKSRNKVPTYTFTIFDGAGEDHETRLDPSSTVCRYIKTSKAIIIALDPLILRGVRNNIDRDVLSASLGGATGAEKDASAIVNSLASYIKNACGMRTDRMLDIPVAIVLTKFDTLLNHPLFSSSAVVKSSSIAIDKDGHIYETELKQVDSEIRHWLNGIGEGNFIKALDANFKEYCFFGVSSFGSAPDKSQHLSTIKPHRVLDPVLWLFKKAKFID